MEIVFGPAFLLIDTITGSHQRIRNQAIGGVGREVSESLRFWSCPQLAPFLR